MKRERIHGPILVFLLGLSLAGPIAAQPGTAGQIDLEFGDATVVAGRASGATVVAGRASGATVAVNGVTPGAEVLVYSIDRTVMHGISVVSYDTYRLIDEDADGTVLVEVGKEVPWRSLWIAFELASGAHALEQASFGVREVGFSERGRWNGEALEYRQEMIYVVMARAQGGMWSLRSGDGGPSDFDGAADGKITIHPQRMVALAGSQPPPDSLAAQGQDLLVIIDPQRMNYAVVPGKED